MGVLPLPQTPSLSHFCFLTLAQRDLGSAGLTLVGFLLWADMSGFSLGVLPCSHWVGWGGVVMGAYQCKGGPAHHDGQARQ